IKEYEEETNLAAYAVLDASESMSYKSAQAPVSKLEYGKFIAAALLYMILNQRDSVGLVTFDKEVREFIAPSSHASHLKLLLNQLQKTEARGETGLGGIFHALAERIRRKGLVIVISDLLDQPESLLFGLRHLRHRKHEVILFHVMDKAELTFPFDNMLKLEGLEVAREELIDPIAIRKSYLDELHRYLEALRKGCRTNKIDYVPIDTSMPLDIALTGYLATRSGMKLK
ncbi:MAG TPA: VWA domain-containing protein, partial [Planctomycetota bacterium]|nr:VWA domain-containing protein [Planctomycetota bacterium]